MVDYSVILVIVILSLGSISGCHCRLCSISRDTTYMGNVLDCSDAEMSSNDIKNLIFSNVTTLILNGNGIKTFFNNSFSQFTEMKQLECLSCDLRVLEVDALKGLSSLEALLLSNNYLLIKNHAFPHGFFRHVPQLKTLHLDHNGNNGQGSNYSEFIDIFDSLPNLTNLTIDSFSNLVIGEEFSNLRNLKSLEITCESLEKISNESLKGFENSTVRHFGLLDGSNYYDDENCENLFQYLPNVSSLTIDDMLFGNTMVMKMMKPLQGKHLDLLRVNNVGIYHSRKSEEERLHDRSITAEMLQYLKNVCISHFVWLYSYAFSIDVQSLTSRQWRNCLKSVTFVTGKVGVITNTLYLFQLCRLRNIESIIFALDVDDEAIDFWKQKPQSDSLTDKDKNHRIGTRKSDSNLMKRIATLSNKTDITKKSPKSKIYYGRSENTTQTPLKSHDNNVGRLVAASNADHLIYHVKIPQFLTTVVLNNVYSLGSHSYISFEKNSLKSVTVRNSETTGSLYGHFIGLSSLESIDFTGSHVLGLPTFFTFFPKLLKLLMRDTGQTSTFYSKMAEYVPTVEYLDIADNGLEWLPINTFRYNKDLKYLCLASNHFGRIPFDLGITPNLEILDLRHNSIVLTYKDLQSIDKHIHHVTNFYLLLGNNQISCACSALPFLQWLQDTTVNLDMGRNYTCMTENGILSNTASFNDVKSLWRDCHGQSYFLVSLILLSSLVSLYMATFLGMKHKTQILSSVMKLLVPGFRLKTRRDFKFDVVIGYADQDGNFVRDVVLRYLEDKWHLKTFVHQRDMLQDPLMMSQAIRDSWRSLLLITENFLDRHHMAHNVMKVCNFFVNPSNPRSVIVMVEESVRHRIPDYVLQVVDEDNIIVLPSLQGWLDYETKETLKTRILTG